jgi:vacuolar-type H+-ATPase subunit H
MASESLLEIVAQHEKQLMESLEGAREEARKVVDAAHAESANVLHEAGATLEAEVAVLRRDAAQAREAQRVAIEQAAAAEVERIRAESAVRTEAVRRELIARILPGAV